MDYAPGDTMCFLPSVGNDKRVDHLVQNGETSGNYYKKLTWILNP